MVFEVEAVVHIEIGPPSYQIAHFFPEENDENLRSKLDLLEEKWKVANLRVVAYKQCSAWYYNSKVKSQAFKVGDLVLRKLMQNTQEQNTKVLGLNLEGPYQIIEVFQLGTYLLIDLNGKLLSHP